MITQVWRAIGIAFAVGLLVVVAVLAGAEPQVAHIGRIMLGGAVETDFDLRIDDLSLLMLGIVGVVGPGGGEAGLSRAVLVERAPVGPRGRGRTAGPDDRTDEHGLEAPAEEGRPGVQ